MKEYHCLRSGACCVSFEVQGVPGYLNGIKPEGEACIHLVKPFQDESGRWHRAACKLYSTTQYPTECSEFNFPGPGKNCGLGSGVWKQRGVVEPEWELLD